MESFYKAYWLSLLVTTCILILASSIYIAAMANSFFAFFMVFMMLVFSCVYFAVINIGIFFSIAVLFFLVLDKFRVFNFCSALILGVTIGFLNKGAAHLLVNHVNLPIFLVAGTVFGIVLYCLYYHFEKELKKGSRNPII